MQDDNITPVNHSTFSAATSTAASAAGHGLKSGASAAFKWIVTFAVVGAVVGLLASTVGFGFLAGLGGGAVSGAVWGTIGGALIAGAIGVATSMFPAVLGGAWGLGKGTVEGSRRVSQERGAAAEMNAQLSALQAQAAMSQMPQTNIYTAPAQENLINPQGSRTNAALSGIDAGSVAYDGKMASQMQAARV